MYVQNLTHQSDVPTVTPALVHKVKAENVWLGHAEEVPTGGACVQFSLPQAFHSARIADLLEVQRQAGIFYVHTQLGVPQGKVFVLSSIALHRSARATSPAGRTPGGRIVVRSVDAAGGSSRLQSADLGFQLMADDGVASGGARVRFLPESVYTRMRLSRQAHQLSDGVRHIGGPRIKSGGLYEAPIIADPHDQLLSDHESDHVSAMAIIVSIERGLLELGAERVDSFAAEFREYVELGAQSHYALSLRPNGVFVGTVLQSARVCATFEGRAIGMSQDVKLR